jgi:hypothetical protein
MVVRFNDTAEISNTCVSVFSRTPRFCAWRSVEDASTRFRQEDERKGVLAETPVVPPRATLPTRCAGETLTVLSAQVVGAAEERLLRAERGGGTLMAARRGEGGADGDDPASASGCHGGGRLMGQEAVAGQVLVANASSQWAGVVSSTVGGIADQEVDRVGLVVAWRQRVRMASALRRSVVRGQRGRLCRCCAWRACLGSCRRRVEYVFRRRQLVRTTVTESFHPE